MSTIELVMPKGTLTVEVLPNRGDRAPTCKGCGQPIRFAKTPRGKHIPISEIADNSGRMEAHFASCPKADEFRKPQ